MAETWSVVTYLLVVLFAMSEGITHAILWSRKGAESFRWNEHFVFVITRILFGVAIMLPGSEYGLLAGVFAYPFFHNGFYYWFRNRIDGSYPKGFVSESSTSTADINFSFNTRATLFVVSLLVLFAIMLY